MGLPIPPFDGRDKGLLDAGHGCEFTLAQPCGAAEVGTRRGPLSYVHYYESVVALSAPRFCQYRPDRPAPRCEWSAKRALVG